MGVKRWWVSKYKLPPSDPRFQGQTFPELLLEWAEDRLYRRKQLIEEMELAQEGEIEIDMTAAHKELAVLNKALGYPDAAPQDDLWDQWEKDLAEGRTPDLEAVPNA